MAKKKRSKKKYRKDEFADIVCSKCRMCPTTDRPDFCYFIYKKNTARFFEHSYPRLLKTGGYWPNSKNKNKRLFKDIFCTSGACGKKKKRGKKCKELHSCMTAFYPSALEVIRAGGGINKGMSNMLGFLTKSKRRKKKKKAKYIVEPYPTFFCSNNEEWKKEIREALYGKDNIEEQDGGGESTAESEGGSDTRTDTSKSDLRIEHKAGV